MPLGVQYSGMWTLAQQLQAIGAGTWKGISLDSLYVWGNNGSGQTGDNTTVTKSSPVQVGSLTTWSQISGGQTHSMAIKTDGTLWTWGFNNNGRLGDGTGTFRSSPVQIGSSTTWSQIAGGDSTSMAISHTIS
jgi:alpha-tubulin suppressor-like RCC1 family protein